VSVISPSLLPLLIHRTVCHNMSRPHPLCPFSEVASRLSSLSVPSHDFHRNISSACAVTAVVLDTLIVLCTFTDYFCVVDLTRWLVDAAVDDDLPTTAKDVATAIRTSSSQWSEQVVGQLVTLLGRSAADNDSRQLVGYNFRDKCFKLSLFVSWSQSEQTRQLIIYTIV